MQLSEADRVADKPFHNQLRKETFPTFMEQLTRLLLSLLLNQSTGEGTQHVSAMWSYFRHWFAQEKH